MDIKREIYNNFTDILKKNDLPLDFINEIRNQLKNNKVQKDNLIDLIRKYGGIEQHED